MLMKDSSVENIHNLTDNWKRRLNFELPFFL